MRRQLLTRHCTIEFVVLTIDRLSTSNMWANLVWGRNHVNTFHVNTWSIHFYPLDRIYHEVHHLPWSGHWHFSADIHFILFWNISSWPNRVMTLFGQYILFYFYIYFILLLYGILRPMHFILFYFLFFIFYFCFLFFMWHVSATIELYEWVVRWWWCMYVIYITTI